METVSSNRPNTMQTKSESDTKLVVTMKGIWSVSTFEQIYKKYTIKKLMYRRCMLETRKMLEEEKQRIIDLRARNNNGCMVCGVAKTIHCECYTKESNDQFVWREKSRCNLVICEDHAILCKNCKRIACVPSHVHKCCVCTTSLCFSCSMIHNWFFCECCHFISCNKCPLTHNCRKYSLIRMSNKK